MASDSSLVPVKDKTAPPEFQKVFRAMDALRTGAISLDEYRKIPQATRRAAKQWRIQRANIQLIQRHPDLSLVSDI